MDQAILSGVLSRLLSVFLDDEVKDVACEVIRNISLHVMCSFQRGTGLAAQFLRLG